MVGTVGTVRRAGMVGMVQTLIVRSFVRTIGMAGGNGRDSRDVGDVVIRTEVSWPTMVNRNTVFFFAI